MASRALWQPSTHGCLDTTMILQEDHLGSWLFPFDLCSFIRTYAQVVYTYAIRSFTEVLFKFVTSIGEFLGQ
jgi:hypothetical protein